MDLTESLLNTIKALGAFSELNLEQIHAAEEEYGVYLYSRSVGVRVFQCDLPGDSIKNRVYYCLTLGVVYRITVFPLRDSVETCQWAFSKHCVLGDLDKQYQVPVILGTQTHVSSLGLPPHTPVTLVQLDREKGPVYSAKYLDEGVTKEVLVYFVHPAEMPSVYRAT